MLEAGVDAKEKTLAEARHKLAVIDDTVEKKRDMLRKINEARTALLSGNSDPAYEEALTTIAAADAEDSLDNLYAEARRTPTRADEAIVGQLEAIDGRIVRTEAEISACGARRSTFRTAGPRWSRCASNSAGRATTIRNAPSAMTETSPMCSKECWKVASGVARYGICCGRATPTGPRGLGRTSAAELSLPFPLPGGMTPDATGGNWRNPSSRGGWTPEPPSSRSDNEDFSTGWIVLRPES